MRQLIIVAYGAGTDSTAMLKGMAERGIKPDLILFADTGNERPGTYEYIAIVNCWLKENKMPEIITVRKVNRYGQIMTLEQNCLDQKMLPSLAYGFKSCSQKFKIQPQDKFVNHWEPAVEIWKQGGRCVKAIGYDADEERRANIFDDNKYTYWYPMIEWGWGRQECIDAIDRAGLPQPGKSSCFFCPSMKKKEIWQLYHEHPDLLERALAIEDNAELTTIKGLGRYYNWRRMIEAGEQSTMFNEESYCDIACGCYDG